ncbi:hypothetical protein LPJ70_005946, partial [Coemansia sp. RSA 2708]
VRSLLVTRARPASFRRLPTCGTWRGDRRAHSRCRAQACRTRHKTRLPVRHRKAKSRRRCSEAIWAPKPPRPAQETWQPLPD